MPGARPTTAPPTDGGRRSRPAPAGGRARYRGQMAKYEVNHAAVAHVRDLIDKHQYVLDSDWGDVQPNAEAGNAYLERHSWDEYAAWHLGLIACVYRASEWRHKKVERAAHDLLQELDRAAGIE